MLEEEYESRRQLPLHLRPVPPPEPGFEYTIRPATEADLPSIQEIYNHYVRNSSITFDEKAMSLSELRRKFMQGQKLKMPYLVAENPRGEILGFTHVFPWGGKTGYRRTVENSIYLGPAATGKGLGKALLTELLAASKAAGIREVIAIIADKNADASIQMHKNFGFKQVGQMGKVGYKFDRWLGTVMLQKTLK
jgi:L-amino acid N-acyltransferase YncA